MYTQVDSYIYDKVRKKTAHCDFKITKNLVITHLSVRDRNALCTCTP